MTSAKDTPNETSPQAPRVGRPRMPRAYGLPTHTRGLLPWSHVVERMREARAYWISTASPDGRPHATPVDGVWLEDRLYFGGDPGTRWYRDLAANPAVCVHLDSSAEVVILHGEAHLLPGMERSLAVQLAEASNQKYGYGAKPEDYEAGGSFVFSPSVVIAWKKFPNDATRWQFPETE